MLTLVKRALLISDKIALIGVAQWFAKGHWFDSRLRHMPRLQARSLAGCVWGATDQCFSASLSPSPLSENKSMYIYIYLSIYLYVSDKIDFRVKIITKDKEGHFIMIKNHFKEDIILKVYSPNNKVSKYIKQKLRTARRNRHIYKYSRRF